MIMEVFSWFDVIGFTASSERHNILQLAMSWKLVCNVLKMSDSSAFFQHISVLNLLFSAFCHWKQLFLHCLWSKGHSEIYWACFGNLVEQKNFRQYLQTISDFSCKEYKVKAKPSQKVLVFICRNTFFLELNILAYFGFYTLKHTFRWQCTLGLAFGFILTKLPLIGKRRLRLNHTCLVCVKTLVMFSMLVINI